MDRHNESQASSPTLYGITTYCTQHIVHHPSGAQDSVGRDGGTICSDKAVSEEVVRGKRLMKGKK